MSLSARKTVIAPKSTTILGWIWKCGSLSVSPHKTCPLLSSTPPKTCTAMRSFLGAYKDIARCIPRCTSLLAPLENAIKGLSGEQKISWTDTLNDSFSKAKEALKSPSALVLPKRTDQLLITTDASPLNQGLAATMFVLKDRKRYPAEFFSFKLKGHQLGWLPCEKEALAITSAVNHFSPFIKESTLKTQVQTDSRPCVQAHQKLQRGLFSASARVSTFLSTLSALNVSLCHIPGSLNRISDYGSRNPSSCSEPNCQICRFVNDTADSTVFHFSVSDILERKLKMPYLSPGAWRSAQQSCPTMRKAFAHLTAGTRPPAKTKNATELRHILRLASVDEKKGILIVQKEDPFVGHRNLIFCPSGIAHGLITALHLCLSHPSRSQMLKVFNRHFYAISAARIIDEVTNSCNTCLALQKSPRELFEQTSSLPPDHPGRCLAADVICRAKQKILVVRDTLTSYTAATFIQNETASEYRDAIIICTLPMKSEVSTVRVDCAPGLKALESDLNLKSFGISLDFGRTKNANKNPVAEKANQELEVEILKLDSSGKAISAATLTKAVCVLNTRIRHTGLSSKEMLFGRDQISGERLEFTDAMLGKTQFASREQNHLASAKSKARGGKLPSVPDIDVGSIVFLKQEGSKFKSRQSYVVTDLLLSSNMAVIQKLDYNRGHFGSAKYEVPIDNLYACSITNRKGNSCQGLDVVRDGSDDLNAVDDLCVPSGSKIEDDKNVLSSDSDSSFEEIVIPEDNAAQPEINDNQLSEPFRRSTRNRRRPDRLGSVHYDDSPFNGESDTVQNWWPNYPRGTWSPSMDNM